MIIIGTHDHQRLAVEANAKQVFQGIQVSDNVRTVANEVSDRAAWTSPPFDSPLPPARCTPISTVSKPFLEMGFITDVTLLVSSGEYIDGCIRIILRQFMHQLPLQLSSELLGALKLSEADLSKRSRMWVE